MRSTPDAPTAPASARCTRAPQTPSQRQPPLPSAQLLRGQSVVEIEHNGAIYRLQTTRLGKLILTK